MYSPLDAKTTIAIPTYNRPNFLSQTISSLLPYSDISEIIVINDGGNIPVNIPEQVKLINLENNQGEAHAVNVAWSLCKNDYFVVISDDDPQPDQWLNILTTTARSNPEYVAYFPSTYVVNETKVELNQFAHQYDKLIFHKLLRSPCLAGVLINARLLRSLNVKKLRIDGLAYPNDLIQWLQLSLNGDFLAVPKAKSFWWKHQGQASNSIPEIMQAELYFDNVSAWIIGNVSKELRCESLISCLLRSIQILKLKRQSIKPAFLFLCRMANMLKKEQFSFTRIFVSFLKVSLSLIKLKIKNA
jgi:glycosyltransferase involved in cell wall biosynthesis